MSININLNDMENLKEFLTSIWEDYYLKTGHSLNAKFIIEKYDAFKTRPREPRAVNRNEQAKEFLTNIQCTHCGESFREIIDAEGHRCRLRRND